MDEPTPDIGSRLRHAREQRGLTLHDVAETTKISTRALMAIERNDFASLPGGLFRRAYVRTFAAAVGLNPAAIAADYPAMFDADRPLQSDPLPATSSRRLGITARLWRWRSGQRAGDGR